jgi:outer membrane protein
MKKITLVTSLILVVAVVSLLTNCKSKSEGKAASGTNENATNTQISGTFSAAWVNIDTLISKYDMYFDLQKKLEDKGRQLEAEFNTKSNDFKRQVDDYKNNVQKGLMTRSDAQKTEQELATKEQELYRIQDEYRAELAEEQQVKLRQIHKSITDYLVEYNKAKGYHMIFSSTFGGQLLYGHPALDITFDVLKGLNEKYALEKNSSK